MLVEVIWDMCNLYGVANIFGILINGEEEIAVWEIIIKE